MKTKYFSTSPNDENNSLMGNAAHKENSAAYKKFVAPKKEYKQINLLILIYNHFSIFTPTALI